MLPFPVRRSALLVLGATCFLFEAGLVHAENGSQDPNLGVRPVGEASRLDGVAEGRALGDSAKAGGDFRGAGGFDIRIDLSNLQSTVPGNWNNISALTGLTTNLIDFSTGAGTGVSIDGSGSLWSNFFGDDGGAFPDQDWLIQPATVDGAGLLSVGTGSFEIAGLPDGSYQVEVVSARTIFGYLNTITVNGATADRTFLGSPVVTPWNSTDDGLTPGNWLIWDGVAPVAGAISISDSVSGTLGILNAIRVVESSPATPLIDIPTLSGWGALVLALALCFVATLLLRRRFA